MNVGSTDVGNFSNTWFLTEDGLYELIFISRKQVAKDFKVWLRSVIREIRLKGRYDLEEKLQETTKQLTYYKERTYEEIEKNGHIYILSTDKLNEKKCGRSKNIKERIKGLQTGNVDTIQVLYDYPTSNDVLLESIVHYILDRYRTNSNREHFHCNLDYMKLVISTAGKTLDTLKSSFQTITTSELLEKLGNDVYIQDFQGTDTDDTIHTFVKDYLEKKPGQGVGVNWTKLWECYQNWYNEENGNVCLKKSTVKKYFEDKVFKTKDSVVSREIGRGWCGWSLKDDGL